MKSDSSKVVIEVEKGDEAQTYVEIKDDGNDFDVEVLTTEESIGRKSSDDAGKKLEIEDQELLTGSFKRTFENGDEYDGEWLGGLKHGRGCYRYADGATYEVNTEC